MSTILLSINPIYVTKIFNGSKRYEYRRTLPKKPVDRILIYETSPIKKIVGEVEVLSILSLSLSDLWEQTKGHSGISKDFFDQYFQGRDRGYAYELGKVTIYIHPKSLSDFHIQYPSQSFLYLPD